MKIILFTLLAFSLNTQAALPKESFSRVQKVYKKHMQEKINILFEAKTCIESATDYDGLKACAITSKKKTKALETKARNAHNKAMDKLKHKKHNHKH